MRYYNVPLYFLAVVVIAAYATGCCDPNRPDCPQEDDGVGGGQDDVTIDMPFDAGYTAQCVQGAGGDYSHHYTSTYYDVDMDTPNNQRDLVFAPVGGTAYVHNGSRTSGFGEHVNVDMGDGTYIILGHMDDIFVTDGSDVAAGQLLGFEGTTGASTGDHVHIGRHDGDAASDGTKGKSIEGLSFTVVDDTTGASGDVATSDMTCDLSYGHDYMSRLTTPRWHPNGSLVKTPDVATVYLLDGGNARAFVDESAFWSRGYNFDDVALVSDAEMDCYDVGGNITGQNDVTVAYDNGVVWLVFAGEDERQRVSSQGWQGVLKSWGISAATYDDLPTSSTVTNFASMKEVGGNAMFRDGSLVSEVSSSTVYLMSDEIAMPIVDWDTFVLMGFSSRNVIEVDDGVVDGVMGAVGNCGTNAFCVTRDDVVTCGGPLADAEGSYPERDDDAEQGGAGDTAAESSVDDDTGPAADSGVLSTDGLSLTWTTPTGYAADSITLSGEYVHSGGWSDGWQNLGSALGDASLTYIVDSAASGDSLRFSVEFVVDGTASWSCLAPYPPGIVQGTSTATYRGTSVSVLTADDPSSSGCGLIVIVP